MCCDKKYSNFSVARTRDPKNISFRSPKNPLVVSTSVPPVTGNMAFDMQQMSPGVGQHNYSNFSFGDIANAALGLLGIGGDKSQDSGISDYERMQIELQKEQLKQQQQRTTYIIIGVSLVAAGTIGYFVYKHFKKG